jgi:hypothetical protein
LHLRLIIFAGLCGVASAIAVADEVVLQDGRVLTGTVKTEGDNILVQMGGATLSFTKNQVLRIDRRATPEDEYNAKLAEVSQTDPQAMFSLMQWASTNGLEKQAQDLAGKILAINPDHAGARKMLGQIKLDNQWLTFPKAMDLAKGRLDAQQYETLIKDVLPSLEGIAVSKDKQFALRDLQVNTLLRARKFTLAVKAMNSAIEVAEPPAAIRLAALVEIVKDNIDGMYVLTEDYPPTASVLSTSASQPTVKAGPASLADPLVVQAALRERAKKELESGRKLMEAAQRAEPGDAEVAKAKYLQASQAFDRADAMVDGIARSYRIEIARRRIVAIRRDTDADAERFDKAMGKLGKANLTPQEYQNMILNLIRLLDNVRENLNLVLAAGKAYPKELVLELKWAELDLKKLDGMRKILLDELNGTK